MSVSNKRGYIFRKVIAHEESLLPRSMSSAEARIERCFEVALNDSFIFSAISPTGIWLDLFKTVTIASRRRFASAFNTFSSSFSVSLTTVFLLLFSNSRELENLIFEKGNDHLSLGRGYSRYSSKHLKYKYCYSLPGRFLYLRKSGPEALNDFSCFISISLLG